MERHKKRFGVRMDKLEKDRKREARKAHKISEFAQKSHGLRAKLFNQQRFKEKVALKKTLSSHKESGIQQNVDNTNTGNRTGKNFKAIVLIYRLRCITNLST